MPIIMTLKNAYKSKNEKQKNAKGCGIKVAG